MTKIALLAEKNNEFTKGLVCVMKERAYEVQVFNGDFLEATSLELFDLVVLKTKKPKFLNAGYRAKSHGAKVIPDPLVAEAIRIRPLCDQLMERAKILHPKSTYNLKGNLARYQDFPLPFIVKPIASSGGKNLTLIQDWSEFHKLADDPGRPIYIQQFINGRHYRVDFIGDDIFCFEKDPNVGDDVNMRPASVWEELVQVVGAFKKATGIEWGDLDLVVDKHGQIFSVDPGCFPSFKKVPEPPVEIARRIMDLTEKYFFHQNKETINVKNIPTGGTQKTDSVEDRNKADPKSVVCKKCTLMLVELAKKRSACFFVIHKLFEWIIAFCATAYAIDKSNPKWKTERCSRCLRFAKNSLKVKSVLFDWISRIVDPHFDRFLAKVVSDEEMNVARKIATEGYQVTATSEHRRVFNAE
ncbi:MAG: ATP-grasp domain-containing protein [Proteobacteria bacterium]|nr:ATP-grasp domain-containing protein [Pseudomonadota bacterium]